MSLLLRSHRLFLSSQQHRYQRHSPILSTNTTRRFFAFVLFLHWIIVPSTSKTNSNSFFVFSAQAAAASASSSTTTSTTTTTTATMGNEVSAEDGTCDDSSSAQTKVGFDSVNPIFRLILIRHGESENNVEHEISIENYLQKRKADPNLTSNGQVQAQETATYLQEGSNALLRPIDALYVSPLRRCLQTAQPIGAALNMTPMVWTDIYEVGGCFDKGVGQGGITLTELQNEFPTYQIREGSVLTDEAGWYDVARGKESAVDGLIRIIGLYQQLQEEAKKATKDRTIVLVVHGDFIDFFVQAALNMHHTAHDDDNDRTMTPSSSSSSSSLITRKIFPAWNACITVVDINKLGEAMVLMHNAVSHLSIVKTDKLGKC